MIANAVSETLNTAAAASPLKMQADTEMFFVVMRISNADAIVVKIQITTDAIMKGRPFFCLTIISSLKASKLIIISPDK